MKYLFSINGPLANAFNCDGRHARYNLQMELSQRYSFTLSDGYRLLLSSRRAIPVPSSNESASFFDLSMRMMNY